MALPPTIAPALLAVPLELGLGALAFAAAAAAARRARGRGGRFRRRFMVRREAACGLGRALVPFAILGGATLAAIDFEAAPSFWVPAAVGSAATSGVFVLLHAGRLERRGRVRTARRLAWLGGTTAAAGAVVLLGVVFAELLFNLELRRAALVRSGPISVAVALGMLGVGAGAFIATLGGLSRKPRPSAYFAVVAHLAGLLALLGALHAGLR